MEIRGTVRKVDEVGRLVIPSEMRHIHNIRQSEEVEIIDTVDGILVKSMHKAKTSIQCPMCDKFLMEFPSDTPFPEKGDIAGKITCGNCGTIITPYGEETINEQS